MDSFQLAVENLTSPPVLAFVLGALAVFLKSDLRLPDPIHTWLSTYLLLAIGLKGGHALKSTSAGDVALPLLGTLALAVVTPAVVFFVARTLLRRSTPDAGAIAAHYGSVSAVTFTVLLSSLDTRGIDYEGFVAGLLAVLEIVGIIVALFLARGSSSGDGWKSALGEVVRGRSIALLVTGLVVGAVVGADRMAPTDPLFVGLFAGALTLFLIEMGVIAAERLRDISSAGWRMVALGVLIPLVNGLLGALLGTAAGLSTGGVAVMATLAGSASYIAAPAAVRIALPQASPGLYVTASLGVTFPFNLTLGIPYYIALAQALT